ncbi:1-phosphofructokinase [Deinococcus cellulosilyticus NBRC 106333 = KACC 11606]|uniref:1-phosphofructokinase n=1 Tax=Deinococcus cellulosilyticus (strain DSM 18568 / NBRC 106333 / KACC 11606 / 5516J-15) TaxID=1223518 RepID=A0A511N252_DEIC1|nr:1-phosphofructokinase [Deinococcus cellulosilyticus NBRC 106333 = KACC 11606]
MKVVTVTLNPALDLTVRSDHLQIGQVNQGQDMQLNPAGKGVNVASILADWGLRVTVTGLLGEENSETFERLFAKKGIADHFIRIPGSTRLGLKIVDEARQETTDINLKGIQVAPPQVESLRKKVLTLAETHDLFVLAGSLPPGAPEDLYFTLIRDLKALGKKVVLDTSGRPLELGLKARPTAVKPNLHELSQLTQKTLSTPEDALDAVKSLQGLEWLVVSMGEQGALFFHEGEAVHAIPPRVVVKSTVGAGDAMVAGLVAALHEGLEVQEAARLATAFSAGSIQQIGANLPEANVLQELQSHVQVVTLASGRV